MKLDFEKHPDGLVPAVVQDSETRTVLMVGFMDQEALEQTRATGRVTFFSRSRNRIWKKGETSGNYLRAISIHTDCDNDTVLVKAAPSGPVCHTGSPTCFNELNENGHFLVELETIIHERKANPNDDSYTSQLFQDGLNRIAQKVGEETVELIISAMNQDDVNFKNEAADLLFHFLVLLRVKFVTFDEVVAVLAARHQISRAK